MSEFNINNSKVNRHRKVERQKGLVRGCLISYLKIHSRNHLNCCPELLSPPSHCSNEPLLDQIVIKHVLKSGLYAPTGQIALREKKKSQSLFSGSAFWILGNSYHLRRMLSRSVRSMRSHNSCSWCWLLEHTHVSTTALAGFHTINTSNVE